ncbi:helix-turn-helix domain-containing protein [Pyxidicoccus xibeiensis]|uniref:helix-turn-helix domain-containing protein n=1 Tax=Pyxidicoccus xibeiensis TaxID=2906759 RepID=UPI0020A74E7D|nr:helix-turn-helix domain-containing protein [Pyxidicoccus xibeiensis]MCP3136866.1 helix-turn-helix domain-containing protein [Pyxidicoccus xibeiensis]
MSSSDSDAASAMLAHALEPIAATDVTLGQVQQLAKLLSGTIQGRGAPPRFTILGPNHEALPIPRDVLTLLQQLVGILAAGDAVSVVPVQKELTTQQAANLLNVSRQYLVQLLDEGRIAFHRTGTHRRLYTQDVLEYRSRRNQERRARIDAVVREAQQEGLAPDTESSSSPW